MTIISTLDQIIGNLGSMNDQLNGLGKESDAVKQMISDLNYKVVQPAIVSANKTAKQADALVEKSKVHDEAIKAQDEALTEAKQGANDAMIRAKSAWNVATIATNAASSAQSDAKQATSSVAALLTSVDTLKGTVAGLQAESTMQASEIRNKVTRSDVTGMLTGYATQEYTQSLATQKADEWNLNLTKLKNDTQTSVTNLSATVDGIKRTVATKADQLTVTELSNLIQTKVSSGDFTSATTQLKNEINQRVQVGDVISQINQEAGGNTLIQVSNGKKSLILDAGNTIITGKAWIPGAAISELSADKITSGTIATGALKVNLNQGLIDFRTGNGSGTYFTKDQVVFSKNNVEPGFIGIAGSPISNTTTNELSINYHGKNKGGFAVRDIDNLDRQGRLIVSNEDNRWEVHTNNATYAKLVVGNKDPYFEYHYGTGLQTDVINGLYLDSSGSSLKYKPVHQGTGTGIHVSDALISIHGDNTISATGCQLRVQGWSWVAGYVEAMGHSLHSALSLKTNIERLDPAYCLALINQTDLTSFTFKAEVASGSNFRHFGPIIDNVNQVAQYQIPTEFIAATYGDAPARDDDNIIGALMGAVQELTKRIKTLEDKLNE
ncbi:tail fiber domain-containing protein [Limosilactobacillus gastricus]|uniref:tail fiber domain-containing protein n=1 Tax=Limosilactobacillus gastricus TaxID=227942 RepID=UPI0026ED245D|nr:tail fiber domain-containing protein [Limosilactobacillus gastricus]